MSGFTSYTLLIRTSICYQFKWFYRIYKMVYLLKAAKGYVAIALFGLSSLSTLAPGNSYLRKAKLLLRLLAGDDSIILYDLCYKLSLSYYLKVKIL